MCVRGNCAIFWDIMASSRSELVVLFNMEWIFHVSVAITSDVFSPSIIFASVNVKITHLHLYDISYGRYEI